jgi:hypothetical protein
MVQRTERIRIAASASFTLTSLFVDCGARSGGFRECAARPGGLLDGPLV